jgi:hypothetical protein
MPRPLLKERLQERDTFAATFERYGRKSGGWAGKVTILLCDVTDAHGHVVADHLWMNETEEFRQLGVLQRGVRIRFDARVKRYVKGYRGEREGVEGKPVEVDYKLSHPTRVARAVDFPVRGTS